MLMLGQCREGKLLGKRDARVRRTPGSRFSGMGSLGMVTSLVGRNFYRVITNFGSSSFYVKKNLL